MTSPVKPKGARRNAKIRGRASLKRNHKRIMEPVRCKLLFHKEERWEATSCPGLPTNQQMDDKE
jgi:hypothetical protein